MPVNFTKGEWNLTCDLIDDKVNIGSDNYLLPSGTKPFTWSTDGLVTPNVSTE